MSTFQKGDKVINTMTNEKGFVIEVYPPRRGRQLYKVKYDLRENDENSEILQPDVDLDNPFERCKLNYYGQYTEYLKGNTAFKIQNSNNNTISSLKASRTLFKAYQFKPLLKFLNSDNRRLLIADEVGLGKTIEAGHIMLEMKARNEFKNALIICPVSLRDKWATELSSKFGLDFIPIKEKKELIYEFSHHNGNVHAVINYDKVRDESDILNLIIEKNIKFSIVICDESHKLRNNNTLLYKGMEKLLITADSVVFMSATPIMIDEYNLFNQLHLLDSSRYDNSEVFRNNLQLNRPFLHALSRLNAGEKLPIIATELETAEIVTRARINDIDFPIISSVKETFSDYPIYKRIIDNLKQGQDTPSLRAKIQFDLSEMNPMNAVFSRTRKREVTQDMTQTVRNPHTRNLDLEPEEQAAYEEYIDDYINDHAVEDEYGNLISGRLGLVTIKRQLASSVWACQSIDEELDQGINIFHDKRDSKFEALLEIMHTVFGHGNNKIIVFAIFKKTLKYLKLRLEEAGYKCAIIYGDSKIDKTEVLNRFQTDDKCQVLLSSEVGSEGLDMQFCNSLVNYDLPWNPMVVEQRIGRIDRFGQQSPKVNIYNIVVNQSILEDIYNRLLTRIGIFRESIGDLEAILDIELESNGQRETIKDTLKKLEQDFYSDKLTADEVRRKETEIARAIENERLNLEKIEEGLTNALTNDSYFRDEINKIVNNNAYVTDNELHQFVVQVLKEQLSTCELEQGKSDKEWRIILPKSDPKVLRRFLMKYMPNDEESQKLLGRFLTIHDEAEEIPITFDQTQAFNNKKIEYINIYHPIIRSAVEAFKATDDKKLTTFYFQLPADKLPQEISKGRYMLAIYKVSVSRDLYGKTVSNESLYPILYNVDQGIIIDEHELAEKFLGSAQVYGSYAPFEEELRLDTDTVEDLRYDFKDCIDQYVLSFQRELHERSENSRKMTERSIMQYYEAREKNLTDSIRHQNTLKEFAIDTNDVKAQRNAEGALRLMNANLKELREKKEIELERINRDENLKVVESISSINMVKVY